MNPTSNRRTVDELAWAFPPQKEEEGLRQKIAQLWSGKNHKIIVLDDDPTGVQTVHDVFVITDWSEEWIRQGLQDRRNVLFILTNTRSFHPEKAATINREIMGNLTRVAEEMKLEFSVISRGDSTLRGHYPLEMNVIEEELNRRAGFTFNGHLIIPSFFEGGRYTLDDTHYLREGDYLVPVHETEFAEDNVFGFSNAHLPKWVVEKGGAHSVKDVQTITLEDIRIGGVDRIYDILLSLRNNRPVIVNATSYRDLDVISVALIKAMEVGKRYLFRTAASFVKSFAGIGERAFLSAEEMTAKKGKSHGGLIIVGSHTKKTTDQLGELINRYPVRTVEVDVSKILDSSSQREEENRVLKSVEESIVAGRDTVIYTSRKVVIAEKKYESLSISQQISNSLASLVRSLSATPKFIVAKGGITSSDIATQGLGVKKAKILGQATFGIPVWLTGPESLFPHTPYIVFPGNVGDTFTLSEIVGKIGTAGFK
ncbi:hydroxyacid dehydrogenase [Kroppenstedtia pulmonis]|uniref:Hydroxyacid dehydrogenase n=1 Tax=Kroppenstedtia pulmonis TaxID=1380685 RepID=A0A7D4BQA7_9BACL|nr:four-carbon acid sugar kinase family protein [Kroppenstedtia pulmonis]QKG84731.1 hydroxyacid dehydrogenase [Kroppenstedtia pulmonis]